MKRKFKRNPLSYLGWMGWIGIIGMNTGDWLLQLFVIYFFFFCYSFTPADELFWENVRKAGFRTFLAGFVFGNAMVIAIVIMERTSITIDMFTTINRIVLGGFAGILCFFIASLMYYNHQDKKLLDAKE